MTAPRRAPSVPIHAQRLVTAGYFALFGFAVWYWFNPAFGDTTLTAATIGLFALGLCPLLGWIQRGDVSYPLVEVMLLTTVPFYAIPILTEHNVIAQYPLAEAERAAFSVLLFQTAAVAAAASARRLFSAGRQRSFWSEEIIAEEKLHFTKYAVHLTTVYLVISTFTTLIPNQWSGTFRAALVGLGTISVFLQGRFWGTGALSRGEKISLSLSIGAQMAVFFSSLLLINGISLVLVGMVGYFSTAKRVPWVPCLVLLPILGILHVGKTHMRRIYWSEDAPRVTLTNLPAFFGTWFQYGLQAHHEQEDSSVTTAASLALMRRASLFQMVCVAVDVSPGRRAYLAGESYRNMAAQLIPRAIWPDKPEPAAASKLLAIHLGLQTQEAAEVTSIGFGMLSEAYANFGIMGDVVLGLLLGFGLSAIAVKTAFAPTFSFAGMFKILCLAWCLSAESTMVVWLSSLYQACVAVFALLLAAKAFSS